MEIQLAKLLVSENVSVTFMVNKTVSVSDLLLMCGDNPLLLWSCTHHFFVRFMDGLLENVPSGTDKHTDLCCFSHFSDLQLLPAAVG